MLVVSLLLFLSIGHASSQQYVFTFGSKGKDIGGYDPIRSSPSWVSASSNADYEEDLFRDLLATYNGPTERPAFHQHVKETSEPKKTVQEYQCFSGGMCYFRAENGSWVLPSTKPTHHHGRRTPAHGSHLVRNSVDDEQLALIRDYLPDQFYDKTGELKYSHIPSIEQELVQDLLSVIFSRRDYQLLLDNPEKGTMEEEIRKMIRRPTQEVFKQQLFHKILAGRAIYEKYIKPMLAGNKRQQLLDFAKHLMEAHEQGFLSSNDTVLMNDVLGNIAFFDRPDDKEFRETIDRLQKVFGGKGGEVIKSGEEASESELVAGQGGNTTPIFNATQLAPSTIVYTTSTVASLDFTSTDNDASDYSLVAHASEGSSLISKTNKTSAHLTRTTTEALTTPSFNATQLAPGITAFTTTTLGTNMSVTEASTVASSDSVFSETEGSSLISVDNKTLVNSTETTTEVLTTTTTRKPLAQLADPDPFHGIMVGNFSSELLKPSFNESSTPIKLTSTAPTTQKTEKPEKPVRSPFYIPPGHPKNRTFTIPPALGTPGALIINLTTTSPMIHKTEKPEKPVQNPFYISPRLPRNRTRFTTQPTTTTTTAVLNTTGSTMTFTERSAISRGLAIKTPSDGLAIGVETTTGSGFNSTLASHTEASPKKKITVPGTTTTTTTHDPIELLHDEDMPSLNETISTPPKSNDVKELEAALE